jgi:hypothetical protein
MTIFARGAYLASAAAGFVGCASTGGGTAPDSMTGAMGSGVMCAGINGCGGKGSCASADNSCKGHNSCKGKGWIHVDSATACADQGGKVLTPKM